WALLHLRRDATEGHDRTGPKGKGEAGPSVCVNLVGQMGVASSRHILSKKGELSALALKEHKPLQVRRRLCWRFRRLHQGDRGQEADPFQFPDVLPGSASEPRRW